MENGSLSKITSGSVTRVTDLSTLVDTSAISVDYLIITHSSLFNSSSLTTLANHRKDLNGYDVAIVQVDGSGSSGIYNILGSNGQLKYPSTSTTRYISVRDFIADVYINGKANHTGDGHLAYICLVGDALEDDNSSTMLPAATPSFYGTYEKGGDYYYACTGGDSDPTLDLMYGRIPVGNETELSNVVSKIVSYESNSNQNWNNNYMFVSSAPEFFYIADPKIKEMTEIVPATYQKSYAYRAYDTDLASVVSEASTVFPQRFTLTQYEDPGNLCGSDLLNDWLYQQLNSSSGIHTFVFEDHGGWCALSPNEGCGRRIFYLNDYNCVDPSNTNSLNNRLDNSLYSFMIFNCCEAGYFDYSSGDCVSEVVVNFADRGAIGVLSSTRDSNTGAFGVVDKRVLQAMYQSLSQIMGEAVFESKLNMSTQYKRQYNLYGDPAVNLWPTGYTVSEDITLSGTVEVSNTINVSPGVTLTIQPGATLKFSNGSSLIVNGTLNAVGTSSEPITFTSQSGTTNSSWGSIMFSGSGASGSTLEYANIKYGTEVSAINTSNITIQNCNIDTTYNGIRFNSSSGSILNNIITSNSIGHGIVMENVSTAISCNDNIITKTHVDRRGVGIYFGGGSGGHAGRNDIYHWDWGICAIWSSSPHSWSSYYLGKNNRIRNCNAGLKVYRLSFPVFGYGPPCDQMYNSLSGNTINASIGTSYPEYQSGTYAYGNWWGSAPPDDLKFEVGANAYFYCTNYLSSDPWGGIPKIVASNNNNTEVENNLNQIPDKDIESLLTGIELRLQNKYNEAKDYFTSYITEHPDNQVAYIELYNCYSKKTANDLIKFFEDLPEKALADHKLLLAYLYLKEGNYLAAKEVNNSIIKDNQDTNLETKAKLNNIYISLYNEKNINEAISSYNNVLSNSELSTPMELSLVYDAIKSFGTTYGKDVSNLNTPPNYGVYDEELDKNEGVTDLGIPEEYSLHQNFPNPFNPTTTIKYQLAQDGFVTLKVYDILGNEVKSLVSEQKPAGTYEVSFDASSLSSGVYIYKIQAGNFINSKKMILLK